MSEVHKFTTVDGKFELSVKTEFLKECPKPSEVPLITLLTEQKVNQFFHNPAGPAIVRLRDNYREYWMNGEKVSEEEAKRIEHNFNFNNKLMDEVSTPTDAA